MSELYQLPGEWAWKKLDECSKKIIDGNYGENYPTKEEFLNDGIPFLTAAAIGVNGRIQYNKLKYISVQKQSTLLKAQSTVGDVLLVNRGVKNDFSNISSIIEDENFRVSNISPQLTKIETDNNLLPKYLYYYFYSEPFIEQFSKLTKGSALRFISLTKTKLIKIPLPPLSEQQRIVSKLDLLFEKIERSIALHQKNMDEAKAFMGSVLNDVFGELEEKYKIIKINEIVKEGGKTISTLEYPNLIYFSLEDIEAQSGKILRYQTVSEAGVKGTAVKFDSECVLYSKLRPYLNKVAISEEEGCSTTELIVLRPIGSLDKYFLASYLRSPNVVHYLHNDSMGTKMPRTNMKTFREMMVPVPPLKIQQKVVSYLDEISQKIEKIKQLQKEKTESLKALKASILDQAFRGEL